MMNSGSSSSGPPIDKNNELDFDLESWINELQFDNNGELVVNSGVDTTTITPNYPSQPIISTINGGTSVEGSSANQNSMQSQGGIFHDIITASRMTSNNSTATQHRSGQVLPDVPKFATNPVGQSSQSRKATDVTQNQPLLHQVFKNKAVQQPLTHSLSNQSNITFGDQKNQLHYQMPSNQLLPCTRPVANTQTGNLQNNQPSRRQIQQNPNQKQLQLQQGTGTSGNLISGGKKRRNKTQVNLSDPVGFATPTEYPSSLVWREYVLRQIRNMKERYFNELRTMHHNAIQFHNQAKNVDAAREYGNVKTYIAKMVAFLNITTVDAIPQNDERVYNYMNIIVNYMNYHKNKTGGSSQYTPPLNPSQGILNLEANMVNFNQNFPSRKPRGRMPNSLKNTSFQMSVDQKPVNPLRSASFKAPQAIVINTTQQINPGSNTSNINRSGSPVSLFSNTNGNNFPSCPINHQPSVPNQNNLEKMKQPMQKPNEFFLPPAAKSISQQTSPQWSPLSVSSSSFDVNTLLSPQAIARSPFLLSSKSTQSGVSSVSSLGSEKLKTPVDPCSKKDQEPESSKDSISHLIQVVNSISPKTLGSSLKDISSIETLMDYIPPNIPGSYMLDDGDFISEYDYEAQSKMRRNLNVSSVYQDQDQFDFDEWDIFSTETSANKRPKIENKGTILEEIKEINGNLLETSMYVVSDSTEDNISMFGGEEGTIVKCLFKNVCFPDLLGSASSEKMPEFVIQLLVPLNYPVSAPTILKSGRNVLSEPWEMLYGETMTRFDLSLREVSGQISLGEMARNWDSSARSVMTEFVKKRGGKSFSFRNGSWENCINSSSGSN